MKWIRNGPDSENMHLPGLDKDRANLEEFLQAMFSGIQVTLLENTTFEDIERALASVAMANPETLLISLQGHGQNGHYVTGDGHCYGSKDILRVLHSKELRTMLSVSYPTAWRIVLSDFCRSDNYLRIRYVLVVDGPAPEWVETNAWKYQHAANPAYDGPPALHFSACTEHESAWGSSGSGGYKTKALTSLRSKDLTLPELLIRIRADVKDRLSKAADAPESRVQTPQIYASHKLPLNEPRVLKRFYGHEDFFQAVDPLS